MKILENVCLKPYNTFGISAKAKYFYAFKNIDELTNILHHIKLNKLTYIILGGGSNILFTKDFDGIVLKNEIAGIEKVKESSQKVFFKVGAGENWHQFVLHTVNQNLGGLENLSLIPGTVGASPMQNIGAYGAELKDTFVELTALYIETLILEPFYNTDCEFGYRESVFKKKLKDKYIIVDVTFALEKNPKLNIGYGAIKEILSTMNVEIPTVKNVSEAICSIRSSKLPDPAEIGNAGSFFKNPEIDKVLFKQIYSKNKDMPHYNLPNKKVKIPAAWLIEQCGWKGKQIGEYGVHKNQALVLVNYGNASGNEILELSESIKSTVKEKFNIKLETEVNIL